MRLFVAAAFAVVVSADKSDFPEWEDGHAGCRIEAQYDNVSCSDLYTIMTSMIDSWSPEPIEHPGSYSVYESATDDYIWSKRLTYHSWYTDDLLFEFTSLGDDSC